MSGEYQPGNGPIPAPPTTGSGVASPPGAADQAIELAYGLLWLAPTDKATKVGRCAYLARQALLGHLDRDSKVRGIQRAMVVLAASLEESRP